MRGGKPLGLRGRLTLFVSAGAAALLALLTLGFNLALRASLDHDANRVLAGRATASLGGVHLHRGHIATVEAPDAAARTLHRRASST